MFVAGGMSAIITDLPFKVSQKTIVILKEVPVLQCERCNEYLLEDPVMERVEAMINKVDERLRFPDESPRPSF